MEYQPKTNTKKRFHISLEGDVHERLLEESETRDVSRASIITEALRKRYKIKADTA